MNEDLKKMQLQVHLTEYTALRDEMLALIKWRDSLVFISLSISGAIYSFVFSQDESVNILDQTHWNALYLVAPLATLVGGLWMVNSWRISRIGNYLHEITAFKINKLLNPISGNDKQPEVQTLEWEGSNQRIKFKWKRRSVEWLIYLMTFVVSGILSQALLLSNLKGSFCQQFNSLEFPSVYIVNSVMVLIAFAGFMDYLLKGFKYRKKSNLRLND